MPKTLVTIRLFDSDTRKSPITFHSFECFFFKCFTVQEDDEYECASVLHSHSQDVKRVTWHPHKEVCTKLCRADLDIKRSGRVYAKNLENPWALTTRCRNIWINCPRLVRLYLVPRAGKLNFSWTGFIRETSLRPFCPSCKLDNDVPVNCSLSSKDNLYIQLLTTLSFLSSWHHHITINVTFLTGR